MQLSEDSNAVDILIQKYDFDCIQINDTEYKQSILLTPKHVEVWPLKNFADINQDNVAAIIAQKPEVVIFGTGRDFQLLPAELMTLFHNKKIGVESMDTGAACRTYAALASEGRNVLAAMIIEA